MTDKKEFGSSAEFHEYLPDDAIEHGKRRVKINLCAEMIDTIIAMSPAKVTIVAEETDITKYYHDVKVYTLRATVEPSEETPANDPIRRDIIFNEYRGVEFYFSVLNDTSFIGYAIGEKDPPTVPIMTCLVYRFERRAGENAYLYKFAGSR